MVKGELFARAGLRTWRFRPAAAARVLSQTIAAAWIWLLLAPTPAQALDPAPDLTVQLGPCFFTAYSNVVVQPGLDNDIFSAGIVVEAPGGVNAWAEGIAFSGVSGHRFLNNLNRLDQTVLNSCATSANRVVFVGSERLGSVLLEQYSLAAGFRLTVDQIRNNGDKFRFVFSVVDSVQPDEFFDAIDYDAANSALWGGTDIRGDQFYLGSNPVADAGPDLVADSGDFVTIDASESEDRDGTITSVVWTQAAGPTVTLDTTDPLRPTFTAPAIAADTRETVTFRMVPTDDDGNTPLTGFTYDADDDDTVNITISGADETAPAITAPADVSIIATAGASSANVTFGTATVTDSLDPSPTVTYTLGGVPVASGDSFPVGTNVITITATDAAGNVATETFTVTVEASAPATMTMSVDPAGAPGGVARSIRYTITMPPGVATPDDIGFLHDTAFQAPGVNIDPARLPANPCGVGSSIASFPTLTPGFFQMSGGKLNAGESCTFTVGINVAPSIAPGSYTQLTGPVSTTVGGQLLSSPAVTAPWSVSAPEPATLAMEVLPNNAPAGEPRTLRYTLSLPAENATPDSIEFDHFVDFQAAGVTVDRSQLPTNPCGTGSSFTFFASDAQYGLRGAQLSPGGSCTFDVVIDVPSTLAPGDYGQLTGPPRTLIGATTLTSAAVSASFSVAAAAPVANADENFLTEDTATVTGNVLRGPGAAAGDVADDNPFPAAQPVIAASGAGSRQAVSGSGTSIEGTRGTLMIRGDGQYTYALNFTAPGVQALRDGEALSDVFTYVIANADGGEGSATLTINITGVDQRLFAEDDGNLGSEGFLENERDDNVQRIRITSLTPGSRLIDEGFGLALSYEGGTSSVTVDVKRFFVSMTPIVTDRGTVTGFVAGGTQERFRLDVTVDLLGQSFPHAEGVEPPELFYAITLTDEEGDVTTFNNGPPGTLLGLSIRPNDPFDLTRVGGDLVGNPVAAGTSAGTLASTDADPVLVFSLASVGVSNAGTCMSDADNGSFRVVGDQLETTAALAPGTYTICAEVRNITGTFQDSFDIVVAASDTTAPVITASDISQPLDGGAATASVPLGATVTDNSGEVITPTYSIGATSITSPHAFPLGTTTVTARAEDAAGNVATETFDVTTAPDQPMSLAGSITGGTLRDGNPVTYQATLTNPNGVEVADVIGLVAFGSRANQPSIGVLPAGMSFTYQSISGGCSGTLTQLPAPSSGGVALQGLTVPAGATCTISAQISVDGTTPGGSYPVFGFAEFDNALGSFTADATLPAVTVDASDVEPPVLAAPADQNVSTDAGEAFAALDVTTLGSVTDNSGVAPAITYRVGGTALTGSFNFPIGVTTVTMDASDAAGNAATQVSFLVTVSDTEAPQISVTAPAPVNAAAGDTTASVSFSATATDNSGETITPTFQIGTAVITSPHDFSVGTTTVTVEASDSAGNQALTSFAVSVNSAGAIPPVATDNTYVVAGDVGSVTGNVITDQTPDSDPDAADTSGLIAGLVMGPSGGPPGDALVLGPNGSFTYTFPSAAPGTPEDEVTFTYRVTDPDGLTSNPATVTLTLLAVPVTPNVDPIARDDAFTLAAGSAFDGDVLADNGSGADEDPDAGPDPLSVTLSQNVAHGVLSLSANGQFRYTPNPGFAGSDSFTYVLSDGIATATGAVTLTVQDAIAPVLSLPADITTSTDPGSATAAVSFTAVATDVVDGDLSASVVFSPPSGSDFPIGTTTVTAEVADSAGNLAQGSFGVTVTDNEAPVITKPADITVTLPTGASTGSIAFAAAVSDNSGQVVVPTYRIGGTPITSPHVFDLGLSVVTVEATDSAGNAAVPVNFTVTLSDVTAPTIVLLADQTLLKSGETATLTFTLSEPSSDFDETDVEVMGGSLSGFSGGGVAYSAVFTPTADSAGSGSISVGSGRFSDPSGNENVDGADADNRVEFTYDTLAPTAIIAPLSAATGGTFTAVITLSEVSTDFTADDLTLVNATATLSGSGASYIAVPSRMIT